MNTDVLVKETGLSIDYFIKDPGIKKFFLEDIDNLLPHYDPGNMYLKPDVLKQMLNMETARRIRAEKQLTTGSNSPYIQFSYEDGEPKRITIDEAVQLLRKQRNLLHQKINEIQEKNVEIDILKTQLEEMKRVYNSLQ